MTNNARPFRRSTAPEVVQAILRAAASGDAKASDLLRTDEQMRELRPAKLDTGTSEEMDSMWRARDSYDARVRERKQTLDALADLVSYRGLKAEDPLRAIIEETDTVCVLTLEHREAEALRLNNEREFQTATAVANQRQDKVRLARERLEQKIDTALPRPKLTPAS